MIVLVSFHNLFISLLVGSVCLAPNTDPCTEAKSGATAASLLANDSSFTVALTKIKDAYQSDGKEHCVSFGRDTAQRIIWSAIWRGGAISGTVPAINHAFADLHNHPNNTPPDAGDFYGLLHINRNNHHYKTRFVVTPDGSLYALLVTDTAAAFVFTGQFSSQPPAFAGGPPGFPVFITDESRELKYKYSCSDEMVLAFILEKYKMGISLLKQQSNGAFKKIITEESFANGRRIFSSGICL